MDSGRAGVFQFPAFSPPTLPQSALKGWATRSDARLRHNLEDYAAAVGAAAQGCAVKVSLAVQDHASLGQAAGRGDELVQDRVLPLAVGTRRQFIDGSAAAHRVSTFTGC